MKTITYMATVQADGSLPAPKPSAFAPGQTVQVQITAIEPESTMHELDPIWKIVGLFKSASKDVSEKHDAYLYGNGKPPGSSD